MIPKVSVCFFIKDGISGAFCPFESIASLIPFADEYVILDCGSTDGTLEILQQLAERNPRIRIEHGNMDLKDAQVFADLANQVVGLCRNELVLYHQSDEMWHEDLLERMRLELEKLNDGIPEGWKGMNFWRYQLEQNFQRIKWWTHPINRLDLKTRLNHVGDGMNTDRPWDAPFVGDFDGGTAWQVTYEGNPPSLPTHHMVLDVSMTGGFLDNILERRRKHAPFWHESEDVIHAWGGGSENIHEWMTREKQNPAWTAKTSPFNIPAIMRGLVGDLTYRVRPEILELICNDKGLRNA